MLDDAEKARILSEENLATLGMFTDRMARSDLRAAAHRDRTPLTTFAEGLLYPGHLHSLAGDPEGGKTVALAHLMLLTIRTTGRRVMWIDEEAGGEQIADLLLALGATDDELDQIDHYAFPSLKPSAGDANVLLELTRRGQHTLIGLDSSGASLAAAGLEENSNRDTAAFYQTLLLPLARSGPAVLVIDHELKNGAKGSRYAVGAGAKLRLVDVAWKLTTIASFDRARSGRIRLECSKDRRGVIGRGTRHDFIVRTGDGLIALEATELTPEVGDGAPKEAKLAPADTKILTALRSIAGTRFVSISEAVDEVHRQHGHGLRRETVSKSLNKMLDLKLVDRLDQGDGSPALWMAQEVQDWGPPDDEN